MTADKLDEAAQLGPPPRLLACPFCGCQPVIVWRRSNPKAGCKTAGCLATKLPIIAMDDPESIAGWNMRALGLTFEQTGPLRWAGIWARLL